MDWENFWPTVVSWIMNTGLKLVISAVILIVGFKIIDFLFKKIEGKNAKSGKVDKTLARTLIYVAKVACKCLIVVALVGYLGIDTSGIAAVIASLGVCVGLAVNGALGNIAGGVLILITRPFKVDDFIEIDGYQGTVEDIRLCHTRICTLDNKVVYVPNGTASNANVVNFSEKEFRRVDLEFEISEEESFEDAKQILRENRELLDKIAAYLLKKETITGQEMMAIIEGRDPETVDNYGATKEDGQKLFRPSTPDVIEAPAKHINIVSEPIPMPSFDAEPEEPDESPMEETPAEIVPVNESPEEEATAEDAPVDEPPAEEGPSTEEE